jgi:hypothetical protein
MFSAFLARILATGREGGSPSRINEIIREVQPEAVYTISTQRSG